MEQQVKNRFKPFVQGQKVWLENRNLKLPFKSKKIAPKRLGPFEISDVLSSLTYRLKLPETWKIHNVFHATLLTEYTENEVHGPNPDPPLPDIIEGEEEYEVEGILNHRTKGKHVEYYIKWKGYDHDENSWEKEDNLLPHAKEILTDYKKEHPLETRRSQQNKRHK